MNKRAEHLNISRVRKQHGDAHVGRPPVLSKSNSELHRSYLDKLHGHHWFRGLLAEYSLKRLAHLQGASFKNEFKAFRLLWKFLDYENIMNGRVYASANDVDPRFISRLISWMSGHGPVKGLADITKATQFNSIRRFFNWLKFDRKLLPQDWSLRQNPWPLSHKKTNPARVLTNGELGAVISAAREEIKETLTRWNETKLILNNSRIGVPLPDGRCRDYKDRNVALKALIETYPGSIPSLTDIHKERPGLKRAINSYMHLSLKDLIERRYPSSFTLVPFVIVCGISTLFNPETLLKLKWREIMEWHPIFGADRWRIVAEKKRSGRPQIRSFPAKVTDIGNPVYLLQKLKQQTIQLTGAIDDSYADYVFIFHSVTGALGNKRVHTFGEDESTRMWDYALKEFINRNGLPYFTLKDLRASGSDMVDELTGGDIKAQQIMLNHASTKTTERHYTSSASIHRRQEQLVIAMAWAERFARSGGKSDSRGRMGRKNAATPGYECFDLCDSPMIGQVPGRPCAAFGMCPICPLRGLNVRSPHVLMNVLQLRGNLEEAKVRIAPERWFAVWNPVLEAVNRDIELFSKAVHKAAMKLTPLKLPSIE